jgi:S-adenosylmethionine:tRNA ribosyltransferase-isomerase
VHGTKSTGGRAELLVERVIEGDQAWAQVRASHAPRIGAHIDLPGGARATVLEREDRFYRLAFEKAGPLHAWLERHGEVPLPPYIARRAEATDRERYQTIYAREPGAVAAPTAGLHFDSTMLEACRSAGIEFAWVTLHVGAGTFQPVRVDDLARHRMHAESVIVPTATCTAVQACRARGGRVVAVGTTAVRALESAAAEGAIRPWTGDTRLFIRPGYQFRVVDRLLTNFHLPESTLLMLVAAFAGREAVLDAYRHAVRERYRFFSYGDAMLIEPADGVLEPRVGG